MSEVSLYFLVRKLTAKFYPQRTRIAERIDPSISHALRSTVSPRVGGEGRATGGRDQ